MPLKINRYTRLASQPREDKLRSKVEALLKKNEEMKQELEELKKKI